LFLLLFFFWTKWYYYYYYYSCCCLLVCLFLFLLYYWWKYSQGFRRKRKNDDFYSGLLLSLCYCVCYCYPWLFNFNKFENYSLLKQKRLVPMVYNSNEKHDETAYFSNERIPQHMFRLMNYHLLVAHVEDEIITTCEDSKRHSFLFQLCFFIISH
jgi:hypothetical protein